MRIFRLVLTLSLAATVFAEDTVSTTNTEAVAGAIQGAVSDSGVTTPPISPEMRDAATDVIKKVSDGAAVSEMVNETDAQAPAIQIVNDSEEKAPAIPPEMKDAAGQVIKEVANSEAVKGAVKESGLETPNISPEMKDAAGNVIKQVANSDAAKQNGASDLLNTVAGQVDSGAASSTGKASTSANPGMDLLTNAAQASNNPTLQAASSIGSMAKQAGVIPTNSIDRAKAANPELGALINGLQSTASIANSMSQCYASIEGDEDAISKSLLSLGTSMVSSDSITAASEVGKALIMASPAASTSQKNAMYQLFRIYLDQNANTGKALTTAQEKAYSSLTTECNAAFDDVVTTYQDSKGTISSIMAGGNSNVTCANFQDNSTSVDMTLCVWPTAIWTLGDKMMANVSATFTNYGVGLCDVKFYIINLADAVGLKPAWLPDAKEAFPQGIPQGAEIAIEAAVPWTNEIAENKPVVDILKGWSACPNGPATPPPVVQPTTKPKVDNGVLSSASACFITPACTAAIAPFGDDSCGAYSQLLTSGCSTCSTEILEAAGKSCLTTCSSQYCGTASDKEEATSGAGALSKAVAFVVTLTAAFAFAL
ncbi:hypothetical protein Naga_100063g10 [Nannochloropsis gaditana]|uniref:Uncharacterized protein n=1 Tax=Nannochloropsis gaditana TaxID=72520 RepID=W7TTX8_9STRA|nr:hypothetical protein Naga_100063g10 [Nannochloropsis gaditana]